ncbi:MAG: hypothetical protein Athens071425_443 [Parcubacteria group bacterium Athens0714_25]|nr:MAG: hypothetical protein Athens071425_443 [Parcubacteria group bacterium Athens0714_25]
MRKLHAAVLQIATRKGEKLTSGFEGRLQDWARDFDDYRELEKTIK